MKSLSPRFRFLIKNSLKGMVWLVVVVAAYLVFEEIVIARNPELWFDRFYSKPLIIYATYFVSEFFFGIIPPELFMMWASGKGSAGFYFANLAFFAAVSYGMGYLNFLIGQFLKKKVFFRYIRIRYLKKTWPLFNKYGLFLIIIAALTPVPWSATSLIVGSAGFPAKRFLLYALSRLLRYGVYGYFLFYATGGNQ